MDRESWVTIADFPIYEISSSGEIYNSKSHHIMRTSYSNYGHLKITLFCEEDGQRYTRSVAQLVAEAFVVPPNDLCDHVMILDGDFSNVSAENLAWRPRWFCWKYTHQLKKQQPLHYRNLSVINTVTGDVYNSIIDAGKSEGLLFEDIWRSTYSHSKVFPYGSIFEIC